MIWVIFIISWAAVIVILSIPWHFHGLVLLLVDARFDQDLCPGRRGRGDPLNDKLAATSFQTQADVSRIGPCGKSRKISENVFQSKAVWDSIFEGCTRF